MFHVLDSFHGDTVPPLRPHSLRQEDAETSCTCRVLRPAFAQVEGLVRYILLIPDGISCLGLTRDLRDIKLLRTMESDIGMLNVEVTQRRGRTCSFRIPFGFRCLGVHCGFI